MSTRTWGKRKQPVPLDRYRALASMLGPWLVKVSGSKSVHMIVTTDEFGAPAAYDVSTKTLMVLEKWIRTVDPDSLASALEFIARHPKVAGIILHELSHAKFSPDVGTLGHFTGMGPRCFEVFTVLDEGRGESLLWPDLNRWEKEAMRMMIMYVVISDLQGEEEEADKIASDVRKAVRLLGLLGGRIHNGVLDMEQPRVYQTYVHLVAALGEYHPMLMDLAVEYSGIRIEYWDDSVTRMKSIIEQWVFIEDSIIEEARKQERERQEAQGGGGESSEGEGEQSAPGEPEEGAPGENPRGTAEDGSEEGQEGGQEGESDQPGIDYRGEEGDGSTDLDALPSGDGEASIGEYGGGHKSKFDIGDLTEFVGELEKELGDVLIEQREVAGSRLRGLDRELHKAGRTRQQERRDNNRRVADRWKR